MADAVTSRVAILMPAYNAERFIDRALVSLRRSTYACDIYIVDDGSEVPIASFVEDAPNIHIVRLERNGGIAKARNAGLAAILAKPYDFVACFDADDICHPERIAKQVEFLDKNPEIAIVGTWGRHFDEITGEAILVNRTPTDPQRVRAAMRSNMAIINTSAMIRTTVLREVGLYSLRYAAAEDYELFRRISRRYGVANIPEILVDICVSPKGITISRRRRQLADRLAIQLKYFEPLAVASWTGLAKTLVLFMVPRDLVSKIKGSIGHYRNEGVPMSGKALS